MHTSGSAWYTLLISRAQLGGQRLFLGAASVAVSEAEFDALVEKAARSAENDRGASPVLRAVVDEFRNKSKKALEAVPAASSEKQIRIVVELEQAADSAKAAAQADSGASEETRRAIREAHDPICGFKMELLK